MSKKILFSPVGGTDPIKYSRDGSMLHICRHYKPDIVYLYLSHEMMEYHRRDNRYVDALERLGKYLNHAFEIHLIERDELIDVQQYDIFYKDFRQEIQKIEQTMEHGDEFILNMASGTPAMKSALFVMATFAEYRFLPVQVSTPMKEMNKNHEEREDFVNDLEFEFDEDNSEDAPNRCTEVKSLNLMRLMKLEALKKHVLAYDYPAALSVAEEIKTDLSDDVYRLLQIADARIKLDHSRISRLNTGKKYKIYPVEESGKRKVFEYALSLQIKVKKQEYADFIRGITPLTMDLLEQILKSKCGIVLDDYCTGTGEVQRRDMRGSAQGTGEKHRKEVIRKWSVSKLKKTELYDLLNEEYGGFRAGAVYSHHLEKLISRKCGDAALCRKIKQLVTIEGLVRNMAAHEIVSVTDAWICEKTSGAARSAWDIFKMIKHLAGAAGIVPEDDAAWNSYDHMNDTITGSVDAL